MVLRAELVGPRWVLLVLGWLLVACSGTAARLGPDGNLAQPPRIHGASQPSVTAPAADRRLLVANQQGVQELTLEGRVVRTLVHNEASFLRPLPSGDVLFVHPPDATLRAFGRTSPAERIVARLPNVVDGCKPRHDASGPDDLPPLSIYESLDFTVSADGRTACFNLRDESSPNSMGFGVTALVNLQTGAVDASLDLAVGAACPTQPRLVEQQCDGGPLPAAPLPPRAVPFFIAHEDRTVRSRSGAIIAHLAPWSPSTTSPNGRWVVLHGEQAHGDFAHFDVYLLGLNTAEVYPLQPGAWPAPLALSQFIANEASRPKTLRAVGVGAEEWLGQDVALRIGELVVVPELRILQVAGHVIMAPASYH